MGKINVIILGLVVTLVVILSTEAKASLVTYDFTRITDNAPDNIAGQFSVQVTDNYTPEGQVAFIFYNDVGAASSITEIYFDDGTLFGIGAVWNSDLGVAFDLLNELNPGNLPGGSALNPPFQTDVGFGVDIGSGNTDEGVDQSGEYVAVIFDLQEEAPGDYYDFEDVIAAINLGFASPAPEESIRIGLHVRGIGPDGEFSDSFVLVPTPAAILLGLLGMGIVSLKLRKYA